MTQIEVEKVYKAFETMPLEKKLNFLFMSVLELQSFNEMQGNIFKLFNKKMSELGVEAQLIIREEQLCHTGKEVFSKSS